MSIVELIRRLFADKELASLMQLVDIPTRRDNPKSFDKVDNDADIDTMVIFELFVCLFVSSLGAHYFCPFVLSCFLLGRTC